MDAKLMTRQEAARYLGLPERSIYQLVLRRALPAIRAGRVWRFDRAALDEWRKKNSSMALEMEPPELLFQAVNLRALSGTHELLLAALLGELRELRRGLARLANRLAGGAR